MSDIVKIENLKELIIEIRGQRVLLDSDVAGIYGVETRDINKAVANNPVKFPMVHRGCPWVVEAGYRSSPPQWK